MNVGSAHHDLNPPGNDTRSNSGEVSNANSMGLLTSLLYDPLNYGYSAPDRILPPSSLYQKILVFILAIGLAFVSTVAVKGLLDSRLEKFSAATQLRQQVITEKANNERLLNEVEDLQKQVQEATVSDSEISEVPLPLKEAAHIVPVAGPGIIVNFASSKGENPDGRIQDQDMRIAINELWRSGAEAIAINGKRLGPRTPVRTAGSTILVNFQPIEEPYLLEVIGPAKVMEKGLTQGITGKYFNTLYSQYGISLTVTKTSKLNLPALRLTQVKDEKISVIREENQ